MSAKTSAEKLANFEVAKDHKDLSLRKIVRLGDALIKRPVLLWTLDRKTQRFKNSAYTGIRSQNLKYFSSLLDNDDLFLKLSESAQNIFTIDPLESSRLKSKINDQISSCLLHVVRITVLDKTEGIIAVITKREEQLSSKDMNLIALLADLAAKIIENKYRIYEAEILGNVVRNLRSTPDFNKLMNVIVKSAKEITGAYASTLFLLEKNTNMFIIGAQYPESKENLDSLPRTRDGITRRLIGEGTPIKIDDTLKTAGVRKELKAEGTRSLIGVRVQMGKERLGVIYVKGRRKNQFTENDLRLLQVMADQISVALGWSRVLLRHLKDVETASSNVFNIKNIFRSMCEEIEGKLGFHYSSIQLIRPEEKTIESVFGTGIAKKWANLSKHYLAKEKRLRDIQADIVHSKLTEIIGGDDKRFDPFIYKDLQYKNISRVTTPIILLRDKKGRIIDNWWENWDWKIVKDNGSDQRSNKSSLQHSVIDLNLAKNKSRHGVGEVEVLGTIGAGFENYKKRIPVKKALQLNKIVAKWAPKIYQSLLPYILETIVECARRIVSADSATLHLIYDSDRDKYIYETCSGKIEQKFLRKFPPRPDGLGRQAIKDMEPKFAPDSRKKQNQDELKRINSQIYREGIKAIAAIPIIVDRKEGVLYIHFHQYHRFTENEIGWLRLFAKHAKNAIRHNMIYSKTRDSANQLTVLHSVASSLNRTPPDSPLLYRLGYETLNLLAADVVTIYEYIKSENQFLTPPIIAGRIKSKRVMKTKITETNAPFLLLRHGKNIFAGNSTIDKVLNIPLKYRTSRESTFVQREGMKSSAGVLIKAGDENVGVMFINYRRKHRFSRHEILSIEILADTAGIAIKNRRVMEKFSEIDREILTTLNLKPLFDMIVYRAIEITQADRCELRQLDPTDGQLMIKACYPKDGFFNRDYKNISAGEGIIGRVARNGTSRIVWDASTDEHYKVCDPRVKSELCVPLIDKECRVIGVINVESYKSRAFTETEQMMLEALACRVVIAMQNADRQKQLSANETVATLGDLAGKLVHRLKNKVGAIKIRAEELLVECKNNHDLEEKVNDILYASEKVLRDADKMRGWKITDPAESIDIDDAIGETLDEVSLPSNIDLKISTHKNLPPIVAGRTQVINVFQNLIQNSIDAMPKGGKLNIGARAVNRNNYSWIVCEVEDNGVGISDKNIPNVFTSYFTTKDADKHLGFGLWWVKNYVERIGGEIKVESKENYGAKFILKFTAREENNCYMIQ